MLRSPRRKSRTPQSQPGQCFPRGARSTSAHLPPRLLWPL
uniref:Macaca fascicularis brain cDNA clone: QflA-17911, similar to human pannexin 2 (PANX2), mRNA, RefSeq: NM_052839.2 n=1 Tax=Macaca fascicularis TaxID=9541 RepID=I7GC01_MACFA|nr:unnamed protein product [Macaca fascicularis]